MDKDLTIITTTAQIDMGTGRHDLRLIYMNLKYNLTVQFHDDIGKRRPE